MGSSFKRAIFEEHVQAGLLGWAAGAKKRKGKGAATGGTNYAGNAGGTNYAGNAGGTSYAGNGGVQMANVVNESSIERGTATLISSAPPPPSAPPL
jgi:mlo protein